jgi:alkylation response protein AidB-like acyl-CoA dehydrogenase
MNYVTPYQVIPERELRDLSLALAARASHHDTAGSFPSDSLERLRRAGLLALTVPRRYGGGGAGLHETARVLGVLAEGCASTTVIVAMQLLRLAALNRSDIWPESVKARLFHEAADHGALINALRVEPDLGSPTRGGVPSTTVSRTHDGWRLCGHKVFATGAPGLRWMDVWARTDDDQPRVGHVLVRSDSPGICIVETWDHIGMRATCSHDVMFSNTPVSADHVVVRPPAVWQIADPQVASWNATATAAIYAGIARAARDWILSFLRDRTPTGLGAPLATLPRAQEKVGEINMLLSTNARLIGSVATETDYGSPTQIEDATLIKTMVVENAARAVDIAASLAGNHAHARSNAIERYIRDIRSGRVQAPQPDAVHLAAGRSALLGDLAR